ncbi:MAG: sensor histidine kinase [Clostridiales bacterium]|nr:sensor histidine kinase [Clostridiales bacterium]
MLFKKLLVSYILIIVVTISILTVVTINLSSRVVNDEIKNNALNTLDQTSKNISNVLDNMKRTSLYMSQNDSIQQNLTYASADPVEFATQLNSMRNTILYTVIYSQQYLSIEIYPLLDAQYSPYVTTNDVISSKLVEQDDWFIKTTHSNGKFYWHVADNFSPRQLAVSKVIYDVKEPGREIGVLTVGVDITQIQLILSNISIGDSGKVYLIDENNDAISSDGVKLNLPKNLKLDKNSGLNYAAIDGKNYMIYYHSLTQSDWKLISLIPTDTMYEKTDALIGTIVIVALLSLLLAVILSLSFSIEITKPIKQLAKSMKQVDKNHLKIKIENSHQYKGEVAILYNSYTYMMEKIQSLIQDVYITKIKQKDAELKALVAQINPHFLYNTLDTINWMAMKYHAEEINGIVTALASLLRYSLNDGDTVIEIEKEIKQVESYLSIQKVRYSHQFETFFYIDEEILDLKTIKLIIQPLVENAIAHGIENCDHHCYIKIYGYQKDGEVIFDVINNGMKADLDKIKSLLAEGNQYKGHGLRNVNQRIKLTYGAEYGVVFQTIGDETIASIHIPAIK